MTVHRFWMPDYARGGEPRMIDWDDDAGTVEGDHVDVEEVRRLLDETDADGRLGDLPGWWPLPDARHDPAQFMRVLRRALANPGWDPEGVPASMRGVEPTPMVEYDLPPGALF